MGLAYLAKWQQQKLLGANNLLKVLQSVLVRTSVKFLARMSVWYVQLVAVKYII